ncbi:hypothetical protein V498_04227 [Pseudogymnoascus sp. VKM F-4517 (FW-2822)]|nr:hypothetical protein V498_04227 [Pseudogymnoascus sp. VKM F-4517 (FW-2822)]
MVWGILESTRLEHVPGTSLLGVDSSADSAANQSTALKRGKGRHAATVLVPQPSNDGNDPLHWPLWQCDLLFTLYLYCTLLTVGGIGPLLSASALTLIKIFDITFTEVTMLTGWQLVAVGSLGIFLSALSHKYGKRPGFIFSMTCALVGTLWGGAAKSYGSLVGARVLEGLGVSMFESVMFSIIGDMYFVHERGVRVALLTLCISALGNLPAVLSGLITETLGWRWMFWMLAIFLAIGWVLVLLFGEETAFNRHSIFDTDISSVNNVNLIAAVKNESSHVENTATTETDKAATTEHEVADDQEFVPRKPFIQRLKVFDSTYTDENLPTLIVKPFLILVNPAVIWSTLLLSISTAWIVVIGFVSAQIFSYPPYNLDATHLGYLNGGNVVGGVLGCIAAGALSDPLATWLSKKNKGIYEPEFRLPLLIPWMAFTAISFFLLGWMCENGSSPVAVAAIQGIGLVGFQFMSVSLSTYMIDAYRSISVEVFIIGMVAKNFVFFGLSFGVNNWVAAWGPKRVFDVIGGIQLALFGLSIPMWIFGKQLRACFHSKRTS